MNQMQPPQVGGSIEFGPLEKIATNKYFIGVVMIMMNIGARFMIEELTPEQKKLVNTQTFRRIIVFCGFFAATRDILAAITLTIIFILFLGEFFTDKKDKNDQKRKRVTKTDVLNELNGIINKVIMMEDEENKMKKENEEEEIIEIKPKKDVMDLY
jgi:putative Mn2+ efflux pump MntP